MLGQFLIDYDKPLFRPPAEASSFILQATIGCSWNKCSFCEMYKSKSFSVNSFEKIERDMITYSAYDNEIRKLFIADGNAFVLSFNKLNEIIDLCKMHFPKLNRISAYALPSDILSKTDEELKTLREKGLSLLYIGAESGNDNLLKLINKSETYQTTKNGILKAHKAGIDTSIMIINGLGGREFSAEHSADSAKLINEVQPKFLSTLVLGLYRGLDYYSNAIGREFIELSNKELLMELHQFIEKLQLKGTIFRCDHASNLLPLKGVLSKDKEKLLSSLKIGIDNIAI